MEFVVSRKELDRELGVLRSVIDTKPTIEVLAYALVTAKAKSVRMAATNLTNAHESQALPSAVVATPGVAMLPIGLLSGLVGRMSSDEVRVEASKNVATVTCGRASARLPLMPVEDFPALPVTAPSLFSLPAAALAAAVQSVSSVLDTASRVGCRGGHMWLDDGNVALIANDGHRLSVANLAHAGVEAGDGVSLDASSWRALAKWLAIEDADELIGCGISDRSVAWTSSARMLICSRLEQSYKDVRGHIEKGKVVREVSFSASEMAAALRRHVLVTTLDRRKTLLRLNGIAATLETDTHVGRVVDEIPIEGAGEEVCLDFQTPYLLDAVTAIESDRLTLAYRGGGKHVVLKSAAAPGAWLGVVMPMGDAK